LALKLNFFIHNTFTSERKSQFCQAAPSKLFGSVSIPFHLHNGSRGTGGGAAHELVGQLVGPFAWSECMLEEVLPLCFVETVLQSPSVTLDLNSTSFLLKLLALYLKKEKGLFTEDLYEREKLSSSAK
jgi:hypothetical protein